MPIMTRSMAARARAKDGGRATNGNLRCVCGDFLIGAHDQLLQCTKCGNWVHPACVGLAADAAAKDGFECPFCTGTFKKRVRGENQAAVKLVEIPDDRGPLAHVFDDIAGAVRASLAASQMLATEFPGNEMTPSMVDQAMECCKSSIADLTFSESYPQYCLRELQQEQHHFLQGVIARKARRVVSVVLSNGMDPYTNLRASFTHLRAQLSRGKLRRTPVTDEALKVHVFDDFVHFTLIVTHDDCRGQGLAKRLLLLEMARWCARGRTRGFLNMALQKTIVGEKTLCTAAEAPKSLYAQCGFFELCERVDADGRPVWTKREEDVGRTMINLDMPGTVKRLAEQLGTTTATVKTRKGPGAKDPG